MALNSYVAQTARGGSHSPLLIGYGEWLVLSTRNGAQNSEVEFVGKLTSGHLWNGGKESLKKSIFAALQCMSFGMVA